MTNREAAANLCWVEGCTERRTKGVFCFDHLLADLKRQAAELRKVAWR